jgi:hypothetical protein
MIKLNDILKIGDNDLKKYNIVLHCNNGSEPLDAFLNNPHEFYKWQEWKGKRRDDGTLVKETFKRNYILSFANIYSKGKKFYLFTGISEIYDRSGENYKCKSCDYFQQYIGRLVVKAVNTQNVYRLLETFIDNIEVHEILSEPMKCKAFPGLENINESFEQMKLIIDNQNLQWKSILENLKGVYVLIDTSNNKKYVGSASGKDGIWSRWSDYVTNYTGGNTGLIDLYKEVKKEHFEKYFRFVLLEYFTNKVDDNYITGENGRENFWKKVLNTRGEFGYNHN